MLIAVAFRDVLIKNTSVSIEVFQALYSKYISALLTFNCSTYIYIVTLLSVACIELINCTKYTADSKKYFWRISSITIFLIKMLCTKIKLFLLFNSTIGIFFFIYFMVKNILSSLLERG
jgi:hypothetical protein